MAIGDVSSSRSTTSSGSASSNSSTKESTTTSTKETSTATNAGSAAPSNPVDRTTVDVAAAKESGATDRVADVVAGLSVEPTSNPNEAALARIDEIINSDHEKYGGQITDANGNVETPGVKEHESPLREDIQRMWETVGVKGRDGTSDQAWSAAYISDVMERAGVDNFDSSQGHGRYVKGAIDAREAGDETASHWGYRTSERAPEPGDLVCFERNGSGATYDQQFDGRYQSHCDIVAAVRDGEIDTIGGNVGDSVSRRTFTTDENGFLNDPAQNWIAVLAPQQLGGS